MRPNRPFRHAKIIRTIQISSRFRLYTWQDSGSTGQAGGQLAEFASEAEILRIKIAQAEVSRAANQANVTGMMMNTKDSVPPTGGSPQTAVDVVGGGPPGLLSVGDSRVGKHQLDGSAKSTNTQRN
jgi:hypothetical protein